MQANFNQQIKIQQNFGMAVYMKERHADYITKAFEKCSAAARKEIDETIAKQKYNPYNIILSRKKTIFGNKIISQILEKKFSTGLFTSVMGLIKKSAKYANKKYTDNGGEVLLIKKGEI